MSAHEVPEGLTEYFGHDKVAHRGRGGLPAAPPAPPGSTARKAGQNAVADGLAKAGTPGLRPGARPAKVPPKPALPRRMRAGGERALFEQSMRRLGPVAKAPAAARRGRRVLAGGLRARLREDPVADQEADGHDDLGGQALAEVNASAGSPGPHRPVSTT